jgi:2-polyprenyl-3-methyl-5-hydroxy-6-metoxy-1,4-benzoquinol methylase
MFKSDTDKDWEKYGKENPYFGVLTDDKYLADNLTDEDKKEFFETGTQYIEEVITKVQKYIGADYKIHQAIDFGCGVGRLVIPLARISESVTGIDISESMLREADENCKLNFINNANFIKSDDTLSQLKGKYNFIHSYIVFQHIPVDRGEQLFVNLLSHLDDDGVCVAHFTYHDSTKKSRQLGQLLRKYIPIAVNIINLLRGRSFFQPAMQMNSYNLNKLLLIVQETGSSDSHIEFADHAGVMSVTIFFKKSKKSEN